ncbi:MAG: flagellar protein FliS [Lachnospiraceae bacterium]|nr:flagellar protein FliS [Lachnospiraceae bacterium]
MTREEIQGFTAKISQCNRTELVVISYDIMKVYIRDAKKALAAEDEKLFIWNIKKAKSMLEELMNALDFNYPQVTNNLMSLYLFIQSRFNKCIFKKQDVNLDVVVRIVDKLQAGFAEVAKEDTTGPVMENTSAVYAGITYGKGTLNEMYEEKNGFRV